MNKNSKHMGVPTHLVIRISLLSPGPTARRQSTK